MPGLEFLWLCCFEQRALDQVIWPIKYPDPWTEATLRPAPQGLPNKSSLRWCCKAHSRCSLVFEYLLVGWGLTVYTTHRWKSEVWFKGCETCGYVHVLANYVCWGTQVLVQHRWGRPSHLCPHRHLNSTRFARGLISMDVLTMDRNILI